MGVRPTGGTDHLLDRSLFGLRWRRLDLIHAGRPFLRRRGIEHPRVGGVLVHALDGPDPGLDLHDHPWSFVTIVLRGGYSEKVATIGSYRYQPGTWGAWLFDGEPDGFGGLASQLPLAGRAAVESSLRSKTSDGSLPHDAGCGLTNQRTRRRRRWSIHRMPLDVAHRITDVEPGTVTLVFRTRKRREWGFYPPSGWVRWQDYDYESRRPLSVASNRPGETMGRES